MIQQGDIYNYSDISGCGPLTRPIKQEEPSMPTAAIPTATMAQVELPPMPIEPSFIIEGTPTARGIVLMQTKDRRISTGYWECTTGKFHWTYGWDEFVHILEGEATIREEGGPTHTLRA